MDIGEDRFILFDNCDDSNVEKQSIDDSHAEKEQNIEGNMLAQILLYM